jgi:hypothetical protein
MSGAAGSVADQRDSKDASSKTSSCGGIGPLERITVNLIARASRALQKVSELTGDSKTDSINRELERLKMF